MWTTMPWWLTVWAEVRAWGKSWIWTQAYRGRYLPQHCGPLISQGQGREGVHSFQSLTNIEMWVFFCRLRVSSWDLDICQHKAGTYIQRCGDICNHNGCTNPVQSPTCVSLVWSIIIIVLWVKLFVSLCSCLFFNKVKVKALPSFVKSRREKNKYKKNWTKRNNTNKKTQQNKTNHFRLAL